MTETVKPGYKQTEVGIIPEDWALKPLSKLFAFSGGYTASRAQLSDVGHCYLHYGDIHAASKTTVDTEADLQNIPRLNVSLGDVSPKSLLRDGGVVFVDASEDDEGASKHVVVENRPDVPFIAGLHTIVAKSLTDELSKQYRLYCFQTRAIRQQFLYYAVGTKVKGISKTNIAKLWLPIPPLPEQRAIAAALSDVDALLGGLDRLIAKKRDLKQAAMQQLLTGQTRLPGFSGEWEVKRLGDIAPLQRGFDLPNRELRAGTYPVVYSNGVLNHAHFQAPGPGVVTGRSGTIGRVTYVEGPYWPHNTALWVTSFRNNNPRFIFYLYARIGFERFATGSGVPTLNRNDAHSFEVAIPPSEAEQAAIAAVLSDMDAELSALEARRDKTRALKQAMMQELLTGRTRLV